jgi:hypothetical protein
MKQYTLQNLTVLAEYNNNNNNNNMAFIKRLLPKSSSARLQSATIKLQQELQ